MITFNVLITMVLLPVISVEMKAFIGELKDDSISLTWNVTTSTLFLICKIKNLKWQVEIFDPAGEEQGFCVPHPLPECHTNFPNDTDTTLNQNITTNLTIFTKSLSSKTNVNGLWSCNHGTHSVKTETEVTVDSRPQRDCADCLECCSWCQNTSNKDMDKLKMGYIKSAAIPFGVAIISVLVIRLIRMKFYAATCVNCQDEDCKDFKKCGARCQKISKFIFNLFIIFQSAIVICTVPILAETNNLSEIKRVLPLLGTILGVVIGCIFTTILTCILQAASDTSSQRIPEENTENIPLQEV